MPDVLRARRRCPDHHHRNGARRDGGTPHRSHSPGEGQHRERYGHRPRRTIHTQGEVRQVDAPDLLRRHGLHGVPSQRTDRRDHYHERELRASQRSGSGGLRHPEEIRHHRIGGVNLRKTDEADHRDECRPDATGQGGRCAGDTELGSPRRRHFRAHPRRELAQLLQRASLRDRRSAHERHQLRAGLRLDGRIQRTDHCQSPRGDSPPPT